jgi:predicted PurR-regulated permease PerM
MPTLLTFVALFGGVEAFGVIGLLLGPVLMALSLAVLRIYELESVHRRARLEQL